MIRIISARASTKNEERQYKEFLLLRDEYDFSESIQNPYAKKVKKQISLNVDLTTIKYFKDLAMKMGLPYQTLINSYLTDCVKRHSEPELKWTS